MRALEVLRRGSTAAVLCCAGAFVGLSTPGAVWGTLGVIPGLIVGAALAAGGLCLAWRERYVAFATGLWPFAMLGTMYVGLLASAGGMPG